MMATDRHVNPMTVKLEGGVLDGDSFEIVPLGSVLPPMRLSYPYRDKFLVPDDTHGGQWEEHACWLHYECKDVPEWTEQALVYSYVGKEKMPTDR